MAETAAGPEGPEDEASPGDGVASPDGMSSEDEIKRKFRAALDRKRARETDAGGGRQGKDAGKIHGVHGPARTRRSFRRKSGG